MSGVIIGVLLDGVLVLALSPIEDALIFKSRHVGSTSLSEV